MKRMAPEEPKAVLEAGRFAEFLGVAEDDQLDFKTAPYQLATERGKRELAEDVSKFANGGGGILVLGVETQAQEAVRTDVAVRLHPFASHYLNATQYHTVIADWIVPRPENLRVNWYAASDGGDEGLGAIVVPAQPDESKWFVVRRAYIDEAGKTATNYIGVFERVRADALVMSPEELQRLIRDGRRFGAVFERLDALVERVEQVSDAVRRLGDGGPRTASPESAGLPRPPGIGIVGASNRFGEAVSEARLNNQPQYALIAVPDQATEVRSLLSGSRSELIQLLTNPPELRGAGFDITVGTDVRVVGPEVRRAVSVGHRVLELRRDGVLGSRLRR